MILVTVKPGSEVIETITHELKSAGVANGAIVSLIGAVDACTISNMPEGDAKSDILNDYVQPFELSGTGEITDGRVHIHCVLGVGKTDQGLTGHLHRAVVETHFVNAYVIPLE